MRRERIRRAVRWGLALLIAGAGPTRAQGPDADLVSERWQTEEGLPHNAVTALLQARDGYLWVGTAAGLARFDGLRFAPVADAPHLAYSYIWALHEDEDALWVGSGDGLTRLADGGATTFTTRPMGCRSTSSARSPAIAKGGCGSAPTAAAYAATTPGSSALASTRGCPASP